MKKEIVKGRGSFCNGIFVFVIVFILLIVKLRYLKILISVRLKMILLVS